MRSIPPYFISLWPIEFLFYHVFSLTKFKYLTYILLKVPKFEEKKNCVTVHVKIGAGTLPTVKIKLKNFLTFFLFSRKFK